MMTMTLTGWDEDPENMQMFLYGPFPKHDFAQPSLGVGEPQGEVKVSILRTIVQGPEQPCFKPLPDPVKSSSRTLSSEAAFPVAHGGSTSEAALEKGWWFPHKPIYCRSPALFQALSVCVCVFFNGFQLA